jgi:HK97 gp10 family phage protein
MANTVSITANDFAKTGAIVASRAVILQSLIRVRAEAVQLAPNDKGALRNSIMWETGWDNRIGGFNQAGGGERADKQLDLHPEKDEGIVGSNQDYAIYQEFGTRHMRARPFLRPGREILRGATLDQISKKYGTAAMEAEYQKRKKRKIL